MRPFLTRVGHQLYSNYTAENQEKTGVIWGFPEKNKYLDALNYGFKNKG